MVDYILYIALRCAVFIMKPVPVMVWLFLARRLGGLYYYFAGKKNRTAYANLKIAFKNMPEQERRGIIKAMYARFAQNIIETMKLGSIDGAYMKKYVSINNIEAAEGYKKDKRSIIFLGSHAGSWELSNAVCAALFSEGAEGKYAMLAQPQAKHKKLDGYLNNLRQKKGIRVIRVDELKALMQHMAAGNILGTIADHGGQDGVPVEFFGKLAMTPVGGVRLAKRAGSRIMLAFMRRINGPYHELLLEEYHLVSTGDTAQDLKVNLESINRVFEGWIKKYPQEYLWFYKRWKHSPQKDVLVLSDGRLGHVKQSLACADILQDLGFTVRSRIVEVCFRNKSAEKLFILLSRLFGKRMARLFLPFCLRSKKFRELFSGAYDIVISAGSSLAAVNGAIALENNARSIVVMRPGIEPLSRFDLVIMPKHDMPPSRKNVLEFTGSLNAVTPASIKNDFQKLAEAKPDIRKFESLEEPKIGLLVGGDSKNYTFTKEMADFLCSQVKRFLDEKRGVVLLTTSRRTPESVVDKLAVNFKKDPKCGLFVVASEFNPQGTIGGIFYLCDCVIVSGESISMVSEAAASGRHVVVFEPHCNVKNNKVRRFLKSLSQDGVIHLVKLSEIYDKLNMLFERNPEIKSMDTRKVILERLKNIT